MWRRTTTKFIARRVNFISRDNVSAKFRQIQSSSEVLKSQFQASTITSAESHFFPRNFSCFTNQLCQISRSFSTNTSFENKEFNQLNDSVDSKLDLDEFSSTSFSEANNVIGDGNGGVSGHSDIGFDERLSSFSVDFVEERSQNTDDLSPIVDAVASGNETDGEVVEGENDLEKVENLLSLLQSSGTVDSLESSLEEIGLALNEELVMKVLDTTFIPAENLIEFFKWVSKKKDTLMTTKVSDFLVKAIGYEIRTRDAYALWGLFKAIGEREIRVLTTDILNQLISLFSKLGKGKVAFEVFNKFEDFGCSPDPDTYYWTIDALSRRSIFEWASSVCDRMLSAEKLPDSEKVGRIISHLCQGKKLKDAHTVYLFARENNKYPPQSSVSFLIYSLCGKKKPQAEDKKSQKDETGSLSLMEEVFSPEEKDNIYLALKMLDDLPAKDRKHASRSFSFVVSGLCRIKANQEAKKLLLKMVEAGPPPGYTIFNTIITSFSRAGDMEEATELLKFMEGRGLKPDVYTYAVVMSGYVEGGAMEDAQKILDEAKKKHPKLSPIIYYTLIRGYSKLEKYDMAGKLMGEMKEYGLQANANEYKKLIKSLCLKALDVGAAEKLLQDMEENGLHLNGLTKSLVKAVRELEEEGLASQASTAAA